jgi:hypothetical protein
MDRFRKIGRNSSVMLMGEAEALTILACRSSRSRPTLLVLWLLQRHPAADAEHRNPLPTSQDILIHDAIPDGNIVLIDRTRAFIQLTAMPLLIESEKIVSRQVNGEYVSIITGFANVFNDGRLTINVNSTLAANPGPAVPTVA